jgi:hypothetical protein
MYSEYVNILYNNQAGIKDFGQRQITNNKFTLKVLLLRVLLFMTIILHVCCLWEGR